MASRAALALLWLAPIALAAGCDAGATTSFPGNDMGIAAHDMGGGCELMTVQAVDPLTGLAIGNPNAPARLTASVAPLSATGAHWSLVHDGDTTPTPVMVTDSQGFHAQADVTRAGTWKFSLTFDRGPCVMPATITLGNAQGAPATYRFRALPPETSNFPLTEIDVTVIGGVSGVMKDLTLDPGTPVSGTLRLGGMATAGEVRLIGAPDRPDAVGLAGADGNFRVAVNATGSYTPLLIPLAPPGSTTPPPGAPHLGPTAPGISFVGAAFDIPGGVVVSGSVVDGVAAAIANAHVVMRAGALPSSTGQSSASGAFSLYAEPATYVLSFDAPDWPQASLGNVVVPAGGTSLAIAYTTSRVAVGGKVTYDDGSPADTARVTITSRPLGNVANVSVGGAAAVAAAGRVARIVTSQLDGTLPPMQLPPGTYDVTVEPPGPANQYGLTAFTEVVSGPATWSLTIAKLVPLAVTVTGFDGTVVPGVGVTAIETLGLGAAPTGITDMTGRCTLYVGKGSPVQLVVEPPGNRNLAGARVAVGAAAGSAAVMLGRGLLVTGVVQSPANDPQRNVRVEAYCQSCGSTTPVATSISDSQGVYHIYLPDPGDLIVDGGAVD